MYSDMSSSSQLPGGNDDRTRDDHGDGRYTPLSARIARIARHKAAGGPQWNLEMLESPLIDTGLAYTVTDAACEAGAADPDGEGNGFIEFELATGRYENASWQNRVRIRLTVVRGQLTITAPDVYPPGTLRRTSDPPPDAAGNLRLVRIGDEGDPNLDLIMAADGTVTAVLQMATIPQPLNRADIVPLAQEFAVGIDILDFVVHESRLLLRGPEGSP